VTAHTFHLGCPLLAGFQKYEISVWPPIWNYDGSRAAMTVRENVHQLVDTLPEDRLVDVLDYLTDLNDTDDIIAETEAAIKEGLEDIRAGRTITIEDYRRTRGL
jgi:hypothetical protein